VVRADIGEEEAEEGGSAGQREGLQWRRTESGRALRWHRGPVARDQGAGKWLRSGAAVGAVADRPQPAFTRPWGVGGAAVMSSV